MSTIIPPFKGRKDPLPSDSKKEILKDSEIVSQSIDHKKGVEKIISTPKKLLFSDQNSSVTEEFSEYQFLNLRPSCLGISYNSGNPKCQSCFLFIPCNMIFTTLKKALLDRAAAENKIKHIKSITADSQKSKKGKSPVELYLSSLSPKERLIIESALKSL